MTFRENYFSLIKRQGYEFIPASMSLCPYLQENFSDRLWDFANRNEVQMRFSMSKGIKYKTYDSDIYKKYFNPPLAEGAEIDMFGVGHEKGSEEAKHMTFMRNPLEFLDSLEELKEYPYPQVIESEADLAEAKEENRLAKEKDCVVFGDMQGTVWERAWYLRSMERLMMDMLCEEELAEFILDYITDIAIKQAEFYAKAGVDFIFLGDDIGMQRSVMMSHELYQTWLKPRLKKVIDSARAIKPDIFVFYHSCGFVEPFIEDLIEIGVDVLNPVQPECMDFKEIYEKYGDRISFNGTIGTQTTMPFGTPEEVRAEVFKNLQIAGKKGGLLPCPTHLLEPEVPPENIEAYLLACKEFSLS